MTIAAVGIEAQARQTTRERFICCGCAVSIYIPSASSRTNLILYHLYVTPPSPLLGRGIRCGRSLPQYKCLAGCSADTHEIQIISRLALLTFQGGGQVDLISSRHLPVQANIRPCLRPWTSRGLERKTTTSFLAGSCNRTASRYAQRWMPPATVSTLTRRPPRPKRSPEFRGSPGFQ